MGVPSFFAWLVKNYSDITFFDPNLDLDALFLDYNGGIHPAYQRILKTYIAEVRDKNPKAKINISKLETKMICEMTRFLDYLLTFAKPKKLIYISIDGVAPRSKMNQQRSRRYKSCKEKEELNQIKEKHGISPDFIWDSNCITPGTKFIKRISLAIKKHVKEQKKIENPMYHNIEVILSDSSVPMEGEHKIMDYLREDRPELENVAIYGLDADLIFLSMNLSRKNIYLLRENNMVQSKNVNEHDLFNPKLVYLSIDKLSGYLVSEMKMKIPGHCSVYSDPDSYWIKDFVVLCFLLGNDFLPKIPSLIIKDNGINYLLDSYSDIIQKGGQRLVQGNKINIQFLHDILEPLAKIEGEFFNNNHKKYRNYRPPQNFESDYEKDKFYYLKLWPREDDPVQLGKKGWKDRYYKHYFNIEPRDYLSINKVCFNYLKIFKWVFLYYNNPMVPCWGAYYEYHHAPILSDIVRSLKHIKFENIKFILDHPYKPLTQLLAVLPPKSIKILPKSYQDLHKSDSLLKKYYPDDFTEDSIHKFERWQTIPILPFINNKELIDVIKEIKLSKEEEKINKLGRDIVIT